MSTFSADQVNSPYAYLQLDDPLIWASTQSWDGGEDSFKRATQIGENQAQHLLNVFIRDNFEARTRPGADAIPAASTHPIANATAVRSLRYFDTPTKQQLLAGVDVSATPKFLKYETGAWTDLSGSYVPAAAGVRLSMAQGIDKMLIADGTLPYIYDGTTFTATGTGTPANDVPATATILTWHTARMFAAGLAGAPDTIYVSNLLNFADGQWDATKRSFRIGTGNGDPIVAMASMQTTVLCVFKSNSVWLVNTDPSQDSVAIPATIQGFTATAVPSTIGVGIGCVGRDAWCQYGNDILFMSQDGVRSVQRMQAAAGQWQLSAPLSQPIQPYIQRINQNAWDKIVGVKYLEFAMFFVPLDNSLVNNYVLVWNGRLGVWMGAWTNWTGLCAEITHFGTPRTTALVFGDNAGFVNKWKDTAGVTTDSTYLDNGVGYPTEVSTKSWQFGELITSKTGYNIEVRFSAGNATVTFMWTMDGVVGQTWVGQFSPTGDILGVGTLPFQLSTNTPNRLPEGLRGLAPFNEAFLAMTTMAGWFFLRVVSASGFVNPVAG